MNSAFSGVISRRFRYLKLTDKHHINSHFIIKGKIGTFVYSYSPTLDSASNR